jgi:hypothetical protein
MPTHPVGGRFLDGVHLSHWTFDDNGYA